MIIKEGKSSNSELFDEFSSKYNQSVSGSVPIPGLDVDYFTSVKSQYLVDEVADHFGTTNHVSALDIGCGVGNFELLLGSRFTRIDAVDVSPECLGIAQRRNPKCNFCIYDGRTLPFTDATFDLVFTVCVLHHVSQDDWESFITESYRVLKKGGVLLVFEHNPLNPLTRCIVNRCPFDADAVLVQRSQMFFLLNQAGFDDLAINYILNLPAKSKFARRIDKLFRKLPLGAQYYAVAKKF